jgi:predicted secreted protein
VNFSVRVVKTLTMRDGKSPLTTCESKQKGLALLKILMETSLAVANVFSLYFVLCLLSQRPVFN